MIKLCRNFFILLLILSATAMTAVEDFSVEKVEEMFQEGSYELVEIRSFPDAQNCPFGQLQYISHEGSTILLLGAQLSFHLSPGPTVEQVPDGCHYEFETSLIGNRLQRITRRSECPEGSENRTIEETLEKFPNGLKYIQRDEGKKSVLCHYRRVEQQQ